MTEVVETNKAKPGLKPKVEATAVPLVVAVNRINGTIEPGTPLFPASLAQYDELLAMEAVRLPNEGEKALFEKNPKSVVSLGKPVADDIASALG